jgi:hypothetical protein
MSVQDWVLEYAASKYLRELSDDLLQQRYDMLTQNLWSTGQHGEVTPPRDAGHRRELLRLITHVRCEQSDRAGDSFVSFNEAEARQNASATYRPVKLKSPFVGSPECFAKFGKREHIKASFEKGTLRVAPASSFNDPSLNEAQRDNELEHWTRTPNQQLMVKFYGLDPSGNEVEVPVQRKELLRGMNVPDFYVWCCGLGYDARLFHDFKAEAVLVIRDKNEFKSRLARAMERELPGSPMQDQPLSYYDPYTIQREQLFPIFTKNIRYLHQNEYRFAWTVPKGAAVDPIYPVLGPLTDIAEFYEIDACCDGLKRS